MKPGLRLLLITFPTVFSQSFYIDTIPGYTKLPLCAEEPLSTIVRDMSDGCGDLNALTSYSCFCTGSSSKMSQTISSKVAKNCPASATAAAASALDVFASYCRLGDSYSSTAAISMPGGTGNATGGSRTGLGPLQTEDSAAQTVISPVKLAVVVWLAVFQSLLVLV